MLTQRGQQFRPTRRGGGDLEPLRLEQEHKTLPQQCEVFGEDNAHGSSIVTTVGPPDGLSSVSEPSNVPRRRVKPARPVPRSGSAPPRPSSRTVSRSAPSAQRTL